MIHIGFTGTRRGMTDLQKERVWSLVEHRQFYAHHGDCIGADAEFDAIVRRAKWLYGVVMHPSNASTRAYCAPGYPHDVVREPLDPLVRDKIIVEESNAIIATPKHPTPVLRSGTWTTTRYALAAGKPICIIYPNGTMIYEGVWP